METLNFFETPILAEQKPEFLNSLNKASDLYIKKAKERDKKLIKDSGDFGISYHSSPLLGDPKFSDFHKYVGRKCWDFLDGQGFDMDPYKLFFETSWVQQFAKKGGGDHAAHIHWNTHVNAFYFLKCSEKTSFPLFHDPRTGARCTKLKLKNKNEISPGSENVFYKPMPGTLIVFPGYLEHEFVVDHGKEPFRFIHCCLTAVLDGMAKSE